MRTRSALAGALLLCLAAPATAQAATSPSPSPSPSPSASTSVGSPTAPRPAPSAGPGAVPTTAPTTAPAMPVPTGPAPGAGDEGRISAKKRKQIEKQARAAALAAARAELAAAKAALADADRARKPVQSAAARAAAAHREAGERLDRAVAAAFQARRDMGNLARMAYASGPTELTTMAAILDSENPSELMRTVALLESMADRQGDQWADSTARLGRAKVAYARTAEEYAEMRERLDGVNARVESALARVGRVSAIVSGGIGFAGATGAAELAQECAEHLDLPQCLPTAWGEGNLTRDAVWIMRTVAAGWPQIGTVGGWRPSDPYPDHPSGRAVDVMIEDFGNPQSIALGDQIAAYFMRNAQRYGISYMIWRQRIWRLGADPVTPPSRWRLMADRGSDTANHYDHVHITVTTGGSGTAADEMLLDGSGGPPPPQG